MGGDQMEGPEQLLLRTAAGERDALLVLTTLLMNAGPETSEQEALIAAECFASLAAAGGSPIGRSVLAKVQLRRSHAFAAEGAKRSDGYFWNAAALLFDLAVEGDATSASALLTALSDRADRGDEEAALMLNEAVTSLPPPLLAAAHRYKECSETEDTQFGGDEHQGKFKSDRFGAGEPGSLAEMLALASLASGGGANPPLPANPAAGGQNGFGLAGDR